MYFIVVPYHYARNSQYFYSEPSNRMGIERNCYFVSKCLVFKQMNVHQQSNMLS